MRRLSLLLSVIFALAFVRPVAPVDARAAERAYLQSLPLLTGNDIVGPGRAAGAFKAPTVGMGDSNACAYNPANNSIIMGIEVNALGSGHDTEGYAQEISIPTLLTPSGTTPYEGTVPGINFSSIIQAHADVIDDGMQDTHGAGNTEGSHFGGFILGAGGVMYTSIWTYFENGNTSSVFHKTESDWSTAPTVTGPFAISTSEVAQSWQNRWMTPIPTQWQSVLGDNDTFIGHCCSTTINNSSWGPNAHAFKKADIGVTSPVPSTWVLGYNSANPTLGNGGVPTWGGAVDSLFNIATRVGTFVIFKDTRTLAYFGKPGMGTDSTYCYGHGTQTEALHKTCYPDETVNPPPCEPEEWCYEPFSQNNGAKTHAPPYNLVYILFDMDDLVDSFDGVIDPWDIEPYEWGEYYEVGMPNVDLVNVHNEGALCSPYDEENQILYLGHSGGGGNGLYNDGTSFFAFNINTGSTPLIRLRIRIAEMLDRLGFRSPWALATTTRKPIRIN